MNSNELNSMSRPDLYPTLPLVLNKRTKRLFMGFAAICIAAMTTLI